MNRKPLVSILINNYNYGRFLDEAINSALNQTYPNIEVIVVDDGSTDNSREIIESYGSRIKPVFKENGGQASAFNQGFNASQGEIVCFLDSDDFFLPQKVTEVVQIFTRHSDIGWCFHLLRYVDVNNMNTGIVFGHFREYISQVCDFRSHIKWGGVRFPKPATSGLCFRRSCLEAIFPVPETITIVSDRYLKYTAFALSKGFFLAVPWAIQRIHAANEFSFRNDEYKQRMDARVNILLGYWLRNKCVSLARISNRRLACGISTYHRLGGIEPKYQALVTDYWHYLSPLEKREIALSVAYFYARDKFDELKFLLSEKFHLSPGKHGTKLSIGGG